MFAQLPMYQQKGKSAFKDKLDNSINFAHYLENPEKKFKSIHVAGTNGKGSSCHMLASILQENIIIPEVSLITNIGMDHMQLLGDTIEKIALEKAGIIKKGVPVVISETQPETKGIFSMLASQKKASIVYADDEIGELYVTDLLGKYQAKNIKGVIACLDQLNGFNITKKAISKGLRNVVKNTGLLGRWQILGENPIVVCDTAHNKEGLSLVLEQVQSKKYNKLHMVLGFVNDKELSVILEMLPKNAQYYFVCPNVPRGLAAEQLRLLAEEYKLIGDSFASVSKGLKGAISKAKKDDLVYVGGSTFVVAEIV